MFDIGWSELLIVAVVAIIVVGPKDLPRMLRTFGGMVGKMRRIAGEFQSQFNEVLREAERQADLDDVKKHVESARKFDPLKDVRESLTSAVSTPAVPPPSPASPVPADPASPLAAAATPAVTPPVTDVAPPPAAAEAAPAAPVPVEPAAVPVEAPVPATPEAPKPASGGGAA